jgi:hypothetical protein
VSTDYRLHWVENLLGLREGDKLNGRRYVGMSFEPGLYANGTCFPDDSDKTVSIGIHDRWANNPLATLMIVLHEYAHARDGATEDQANQFAISCLRPALGDVPTAVMAYACNSIDWREHISEATVVEALEKSGEPWAVQVGHIMHFGDPITKSIEREALFQSRLKDCIRFTIYASLREASKSIRIQGDRTGRIVRLKESE